VSRSLSIRSMVQATQVRTIRPVGYPEDKDEAPARTPRSVTSLFLPPAIGNLPPLTHALPALAGPRQARKGESQNATNCRNDYSLPCYQTQTFNAIPSRSSQAPPRAGGVAQVSSTPQRTFTLGN
jgi:hypothetical protein